MSVDELRNLLADQRTADPRRAAEVAYVLARRYQAEGENEKAKDAAAESIALFDRCPGDSLEDCAARYTVLAGIALPSIIHSDVVRARFPEA